MNTVPTPPTKKAALTARKPRPPKAQPSVDDRTTLGSAFSTEQLSELQLFRAQLAGGK